LAAGIEPCSGTSLHDVMDASHDRTSIYWQEMHQMITITRPAKSNIMTALSNGAEKDGKHDYF
jgi:hypothetical protein